MKINNEELFAVCVIVNGKPEMCVTYNDSHNAWTSATFLKHEDAELFKAKMFDTRSMTKPEFVIKRVSVVLEDV